MSNFSHAVEATSTALNSAGSAARENSRYMESLNAKTNMVAATFQSLSNNVVDSGLVKGLLDLANGFLSLLNTPVGQFVTKITLLTSVLWGLMEVLQATKIVETATKQIKAFGDIFSNLSAIIKNFQLTSSGAAGPLQAVQSIGSTLTAAAFPIAAIVATIATAIGSFNDAMERARQQSITTAQSYNTQYQSLQELQTEYLDIVNNVTDEAEQTKQLTEFKKKLIEQYGFESDAIKQVNSDRKEGLELLVAESREEANNAWAEIYDEYYKALEYYTNKFQQDLAGFTLGYDFAGIGAGVDSPFVEQIKQLEEYGLRVFETTDGFSTLGIDPSVYENAEDSINKLNTALLYLNGEIKSGSQNTLFLNSAIGFINEAIDEVSANVNGYSDALSTGQQALVNYTTAELNLDKVLVNNKSYVIDSAESYQEAVAALQQYITDSEVLETVLAILSTKYEQYDEAVNTTKENIVDFADDIAAQKDLVEGFGEILANTTDAISKIAQAQEEYNESGALSASTIKELLDLDAKYLNALVDENGQIHLNQEAIDMLNQSQLEEIRSLAASSVAAYAASEAQRLLATNVEDAANSSSEAAPEIETLGDKVTTAAQDFLSGAISAEAFGQAIRNIGKEEGDIDTSRAKIEEFTRNVTEYAQSVYSTINSFSSSFSTFSSNVDNSLNDQINAYKTAFDYIANRAQEEIDLLEDQKRAIEDRYNAQIEAIQKANEELEDQISLEEALDDLAKARQTKVMVYKDGRFQYVEDIDQVSSAQGELERLEREQALKEEVANLEQLRDQEIASIDAQIEYWEKYKEEFSDIVDNYEEEQDRLLAEQVLGIELEGENWEKRLSNLSDYVSRYNALMSKLSRGSSGGGSGYSSSSGKTSSSSSSSKKPTVNKANSYGLPYEMTGYASGTLSANNEIALVGENGPELKIMNQGDAVLPTDVTKNLWKWGMLSPDSFVGKGVSIVIQNLNLPEVKNSNDFINAMKSNFWRKAVQFQTS